MLRLLLCDPARPDSHVTIPLAGTAGWRAQDLAPDSYRLVLALATPKGHCGVAGGAGCGAAEPDTGDQGSAPAGAQRDRRLPAGRARSSGNLRLARLRLRADALWEEGLVLVYRLLFILKLESAADPARAFSFASTGLWRDALSPESGAGAVGAAPARSWCTIPGGCWRTGLRPCSASFATACRAANCRSTPLGGALFGAQATPLLDRLAWGERAVALLLDRLLWTTPKGRERERVHYGVARCRGSRPRL